MSASAIGVIAGAALPQGWGVPLKCLIGWNMAVWLYLGMTSWVVLRGSSRDITKLAAQEEANAVFALSVMSVGAVISLVAVVIELASVKSLTGNQRLAHYGLTGATVVGSWLLVSVIYSFHYAHLYYRSQTGSKPLRFPDDTLEAGYWDFLYFSFTIAVAAQTSDVSIHSTTARKAVLAQSVLAFVFNAAIIGMSINIAAGLVGS
ncbi:MAG TPA: DUF1345 domain-containing protein [Telluria sp.]